MHAPKEKKKGQHQWKGKVWFWSMGYQMYNFFFFFFLVE